ncbi:hypothetical protein E0Z10_g7346 [Xylaria hypoxylon]|uniref:Uncharacterized protein n=1 Tax=Xylaria hypoxylon TaxID=37992 RepID=A0A4Z0YN46_9PEZI|nr:hypothetical protein E0Z10_g7346 [Xylaria hypoxylon]
MALTRKFKRFRSKRLRPKSEVSVDVSDSSESNITRGRALELLNVPSTASSVSHGRSPSPLTSGLGLHIIHQPDHAVLDIVFVHGLGGHSRRTWSKNHDPSLFWPELWLPLEPGIGNARIFTFGYDAAFRGATKSVSNVTDFAKELLFEMRFGKDSSGEDFNLGAKPIVFVVHSMGGLVTKKAYLLGLHDTNYQGVIEAVSAIVFLSTPHRGTHLAKVLNRVLAASFQSPRNFISDLDKGSPAIEELNEQFRHVAPKLSIWSFYETLATSIGPRQMMVLEKDSSVLGYPEEISRPLQADHHDVCKFSSRMDPNYVAVRNAIKTLVTRFQEIKPEKPAKLLNPSTLIDESLDIQGLFRNCPSTETDYDAIHRRWLPNTCEWFLEEEKFALWLEPSSLKPAVLWYTAPPANGKSVLSTFIINHLRSKGLPCQFFLFRYADNAKRMVANCVKSLALQLSSSQPEFRRLLVGSSREGLGLDSSDAFLIWRNIIEGKLLELNITEPLYWVIDALDECDSPRIFLECLRSFADKLPVRILILSRDTDSISTNVNRLSRSISVLRIEKSTSGHSQEDIELLVQMELDHMRGSNQFRQQLLQDIMKRSEGNFLWAELVLEEIMGCHTEENIREVLEDIPSDMTLMFQRMEKNLLKSIRQSEKPLIRSLLEWSTCAQRPLSLKELSQALEPEYTGFLDLKRTVQDTCGQFIQVDAHDTVTVLHHTTREYFTRSSESEFRINPEKSHEKLFMRALTVFEDKDLRWRLLQNQHTLKSSEPFIFYSAVNWPFHLGQCTPSSSECLGALVEIFRGPGVLAWIHALALLRRLEVLVQASQVLTIFINNAKRHNASENPMTCHLSDFELLSEWAIDLIKIVGRFASNIVAHPGVLYYVIPAVCPPKSITHKQFHSAASIEVTGASDGSWNDHLCRLVLPGEVQAFGIACASKYLAVLDSKGSVYVWDASNFAEVSVIHHEEPVTAFALNDNGGKLCTYGLKNTKLWSTLSGQLLASTANPPYTKAREIVFADSDCKLLVGGDDNIIRHISCDDFPQGWQVLNHDLLQKTVRIEGALVNSPICLAFNGDRTHVGVSYRGAPLYVWRLRDGICINICRRASDMQTKQRKLSSNLPAVNRFTWNRTTGHILGIYKGGYVFKWHPMTDENIETLCSADEIASSPNGKLFATSSTDGSIRIWNFACFSVIYQLSSGNLVTEIAFSPDSRRFYDLRDGSINTWESSSVARFLETDERTSDSYSEGQPSTAISKISEEWADQFEVVTALSLAPDNRSYCVGYEDGNVELYRRSTAQSRKFTRFYMSITDIQWSRDGRLVALSDLAGDVQVWEFGKGFEDDASPSVLPPPQIERNSHNVEGIILSLDRKHILISVVKVAFVCSTEDGKLVAKSPTSSYGKWLCHPTHSDIVLRCGPLGIDAYSWNTLEKVWSMTYPETSLKVEEGTLSLESQSLAQMTLTHETTATHTVRKALLTQDSCHILLYTSKATGPHEFSNYLSIVPVTTLRENDGTVLPQSRYDILTTPPDVVSHILMPLGILPGRRLVFIDRDLWICSYPLGKTFYSATGALYNRFYFLPRNWVTKDSLEQCVLADDGTLFWPKGDQVVLIECSLDETRLNSVF